MSGPDVSLAGQDRLLWIPGMYAALDLGGLPRASGGRTAMRRLVRADCTGPLPGEAARELVRYGVRAVVDLRSQREVRRRPSGLAEVPWIAYHWLPLGDDASAPRPERPMTLRALYRRLLDERGTMFCRVLDLFAQHEGTTVLFHCRGGRDRTGLIAAFVLRLAGVDTEVVLADHAAAAARVSADVARRRVKWRAQGHDVAHFDAANSDELAALRTALRYVDEHYSSVEGYLRAHGASEALAGQVSSLLCGDS